MNNLTIQEVELLIDALTAWEREESTMGIMADMLAGLTATKERVDNVEEYKQIDREEMKRAKQKQVILLKAKLVNMKDTLTAKNLENGEM